MLITYIKEGTPAQFFFGEGVCNDEGYICYFLTEVVKFCWLMLLLYPGELYRLLGASNFVPNVNPVYENNVFFFSSGDPSQKLCWNKLAPVTIKMYIASQNEVKLKMQLYDNE